MIQSWDFVHESQEQRVGPSTDVPEHENRSVGDEAVPGAESDKQILHWLAPQLG
jgi:hypothetical protein